MHCMGTLVAILQHANSLPCFTVKAWTSTFIDRDQNVKQGKNLANLQKKQNRGKESNVKARSAEKPEQLSFTATRAKKNRSGPLA